MVKDIEMRLKEVGNQDDAIYMSRYMRNKFKFLGVKSGLRKDIQKEFFKNEKQFNPDLILDLFESDYREMQYVAMDYLVKFKRKLRCEDIEILKYMIVEKSWWDTVDFIATNLVGSMCKAYPEIVENHLKRWVNDDNLWLRRSSIIFQLRYKNDTDCDFLTNAIESNAKDDDFFIQKAIGWALREYAKTSSDWVIKFIDEHNLSKLSVREAKKHINRR